MGGLPKHRSKVSQFRAYIITMAMCASGIKLLIASLFVLQCAVAIRHGVYDTVGGGGKCTLYREVERKYHEVCDKVVTKGIHIPFERHIDVTAMRIKTYVMDVCKFADKVEKCIDTTFSYCPSDIRRLLHLEHSRRGWMCVGHMPAPYLKTYLATKFRTIPNACVKRVKTGILRACPITILTTTDGETVRHRIERVKRRHRVVQMCKDFLDEESANE